jgi:hypothetical protein
VEDFDLNGNPIERLEAAVDVIKACLPRLRSLRINLHEEDQVDYLLRALEGLHELNGLAVEREALFSQDEEEEEEGDGVEEIEEEGGMIEERPGEEGGEENVQEPSMQ